MTDQGVSEAVAVPTVRELHYSMIIEWDPQDAIYVVTVPELPGCQTHSATYEEAVRQGQEGIETWVVGAIEDGGVLPAPRIFA
jgi:predicted RNase H-like HicB family nuclease